jgi:hypothetical protein
MPLHAVVGLVVDAGGLADDEIGAVQPSLQRLHAFLDAAIVVRELAAELFDAPAVTGHGMLDATDAQHASATDQPSLARGAFRRLARDRRGCVAGYVRRGGLRDPRRR